MALAEREIAARAVAARDAAARGNAAHDARAERSARPRTLGRAPTRTADGRLARIDRDTAARPARPRRARRIVGRTGTDRRRGTSSAGLRAHSLPAAGERATARALRTAAAGPRPIAATTGAGGAGSLGGVGGVGSVGGVGRAVPEPAGADPRRAHLASHAAGRALALVPRRRRAARVVAVLCTSVVLTMLAAAAFQTQLARRQVELDRLDQDIRAARESYDVLRRERAELRSPSRLAEVAEEHDMEPATDTGFMVVTPEVIAEVQIAAGSITGDGAAPSDPLEQFRDVKAITGAAP